MNYNIKRIITSAALIVLGIALGVIALVYADAVKVRWLEAIVISAIATIALIAIPGADIVKTVRETRKNRRDFVAKAGVITFVTDISDIDLTYRLGATVVFDDIWQRICDRMSVDPAPVDTLCRIRRFHVAVLSIRNGSVIAAL